MEESSSALIRRVAFLRAINVGGHVVKMDRLRAAFVELGLAQVETFIASGNVIFSAPAGGDEALERKIEGHLLAALGYAVAVFLRTVPEVQAAAAAQPFDLSSNGFPAESRMYVGFLPSAPGQEIRQKVMALRTPTDDFAILGSELYWLCSIPSQESRISGAVLERALGMPMTMRNITTIIKLAAKYG